MGVYINMEMPTKGYRLILVHADGTVQTTSGETTAVFVPPHGRCVDADKLMQEMRLFIKENMLLRDDARELLETIADAPTVIEAEEET